MVATLQSKRYIPTIDSDTLKVMHAVNSKEQTRKQDKDAKAPLAKRPKRPPQQPDDAIPKEQTEDLEADAMELLNAMDKLDCEEHLGNDDPEAADDFVFAKQLQDCKLQKAIALLDPREVESIAEIEEV